MRLSGHGTELSRVSSRREDRARLAAIVADRNRAAEARAAGADHPAVGRAACRCWRWRGARASAGRRSGAGSSASPSGRRGLLRDKTRKPGKPPLAAKTVAEVVALTCAEPPGEATHWTGRAMAKAVGSALRAVQRIWAAHRLQPHRIRTFKRSRDPEFAAKVEDIVGLYMDPPAHAVVCRSTRRARSRRSTARSRACRSSPANAGR